MPFNSYEFLFIYFPITFAALFAIGRYSKPLAGLWLFAASLFFYGWRNPAYVSLLIGSILLNFAMGSAISQEHHHGRMRGQRWPFHKLWGSAQLGAPHSQFDHDCVSPLLIIGLLAIAWWMRNTQKLMASQAPALETLAAAPH